MGKITHGSLFSGIGGFDLSAEWAGFENLFHCEINEFGRKVLNYYWPNAISYEDITKTDFTIWRGKIDVLTGGFPCQPYSMAGKRLGKEDERHLWPEMLRVIREVQPTWVVGENVPGLINWSGGLVFDEVQTDLESAGYEVIPFILPAAGVNAPHRRDRVWFVAHYNQCTAIPSGACRQFNKSGCGNNDEPKSMGEQTEQRFRYGDVYRNDSYPNSSGLQEERPEQQTARDSEIGIQWITPNTERTGLQKSEQGKQYEQLFHAERNNTQDYVANTSNKGLQRIQDNGSIGIIRTESNEQPARFFCTDWQDFPTQPPVCSRNDGTSDRLVGITFSKWRNESIKACGNAIVPQVVYQIFKAINEYEQNKSLHQHPDNRP